MLVMVTEMMADGGERPLLINLNFVVSGMPLRFLDRLCTEIILTNGDRIYVAEQLDFFIQRTKR